MHVYNFSEGETEPPINNLFRSSWSKEFPDLGLDDDDSDDDIPSLTKNDEDSSDEDKEKGEEKPASKAEKK